MSCSLPPADCSVHLVSRAVTIPMPCRRVLNAQHGANNRKKGAGPFDKQRPITVAVAAGVHRCGSGDWMALRLWANRGGANDTYINIDIVEPLHDVY